MECVYIDALIGFTYPIRQNSFSQFVYYGEKYPQLKLVNIHKNFENFMLNSWYLNISLLVGPIFILEYWPLILIN